MRTPILLLLAAASVGCGSARKQMARAETYEQHGLLKEAHDAYASLHERKPKEALARVGMKRTAQGLLDRKQDMALAAYLAKDLRGGDSLRDELLSFKRAMEAEGLALDLSPLLEERRNEALAHEADRLYQEATEAFALKQFSEAADLCDRAVRLWPSHREAAHLQRLAQSEPLYQEGCIAMEKGLWREAYKKFDRVIAIDPVHKDALARRANCLSTASFTVACITLQGSAGGTEVVSGASAGEIAAQLLARVKEAVLDTKDPFMILVDRDNTERLLAEQRRQMSSAYDEQSIAAAGKLIGARYVLAMRILRFDDMLTRQMEAQVQLINAETGRIHLSEVVRVNRQEIGRGAPRAQLLERAAKRIAIRLHESGAGL